MYRRCLCWTTVTVIKAVQSLRKMIEAIFFIFSYISETLEKQKRFFIISSTQKISHIRTAIRNRQTYNLTEIVPRIKYIKILSPDRIVRSA